MWKNILIIIFLFKNFESINFTAQFFNVKSAMILDENICFIYEKKQWI